MHSLLTQVIDQIGQQVLGKTSKIKLALSCLLSNGHLLIEDLPGMGKTTLSHALADTLGLGFARVQFTSDLLPADLLGVNIFDQQQKQFQFHQGPIFHHLVLADEINRASPKTQSALLEAMEEHQVSLDGQTHTLPHPFFVIATQNPLHQSGTYPLPESQLDRFLMRIRLGYPNADAEKQMLLDSDKSNTNSGPILDVHQLQELQRQVSQIEVSEKIINYILALVNLSRESSDYPNPLSPRASKALLNSAKSWAMLEDRSYVIPEDIQAVFAAVAEHRLRSAVSDSGMDDVLSSSLLERIDPLQP